MNRQDEMNIRARKIYEALFALEDLGGYSDKHYPQDSTKTNKNNF